MNNEKRKEFWDTLISLNGVNKTEDFRLLRSKLEIPQYLYRYRSVNTSTLDALRANKLYFSKANYYDDPFDTFVNVDIRGMEKVIDSITSDQLDQYLQSFKVILSMLLGVSFTDEEFAERINYLKQQLLNPDAITSLKSFIRNIRNEMRKDIWSVCFSENGFNETLWLKYAQQHQGFAVQYDLSKQDDLLCGQYEKCKHCGVQLAGTPLYPVYYSNEQYDGTRLGQFIAICKILNLSPDNPIYQAICQAMGGLNWEREKISLIKKECHKYDEEWRIILNGSMNPPVMREWRPNAVILGLNIKTTDKNLVILCAKEAGIEKVYESFIDDKGQLNAFPI